MLNCGLRRLSGSSGSYLVRMLRGQRNERPRSVQNTTAPRQPDILFDLNRSAWDPCWQPRFQKCAIPMRESNQIAGPGVKRELISDSDLQGCANQRTGFRFSELLWPLPAWSQKHTVPWLDPWMRCCRLVGLQRGGAILSRSRYQLAAQASL
jgi:hypothetical protein